MIANTPNNVKEHVNVNTSSIQLMNKDGFIPSTLILGFWNDLVSIKIHPTLEKQKQTETRVYDYEQWVITALTADKVQSLIRGIEDRILPAIVDGLEKSISVIVNKDCLVLISSGKDSNPFVGIYKDIDPATKKPKNFLCYEFKTSKLVIDYNSDSGECLTEDDNISEFLLFYEFLKSYLSANFNSVVHTTRFIGKAFNDKLLNGISSLMDKAGVASEDTYTRRTSKPNIFGNNNTTITAVPVTEIDDLDSYIN